jgi:hypothetical protein
VHRWSGWPGAWCFDCGCEDPYENASADGLIDFVDDPESPDGFRMVISDEMQKQLDEAIICPEPGSDRFNPYVRILKND